jgi:hypothetical protein
MGETIVQPNSHADDCSFTADWRFLFLFPLRKNIFLKLFPVQQV